MRFCIVSVSRNAEPWLDRCIDSIEALDVGEHQLDVCMIDDDSTDRSAIKIADRCNDNGWTWRANTSRIGAMANQCKAIDLLECGPEDVIIIVDGDDYLATPNVLHRLYEEYQDPDVQLTYGSYAPDPPSETCSPARPYPASVIRDRTFRTATYEVGIRYNHLRTFRAGPFHALDRDLRFKWPDGSWFDCCPDGAVMLALLDSVGPNHRFIPDVLYGYNSENPDSEWRVRAKRIDATYSYIIRDLPPVPIYEPQP